MMTDLPSEVELDRELCSRSFREYVILAWPQVEPARPLLLNWHIDAICEHLEAVACRDIKRLVINVPPGSMKSLLCGVFWPSWVWTMVPESKWITASYSGIVSRRDSVRARRLMESKWYQERWGHLWTKKPDDWGGIHYSNDKAGFRLAVTVLGGVTGEHADHQLVDDPIKPLEARGAHVDSAKLQACVEWWDETMSTRMVDPMNATRTIIMQRLHDRDLAGHVLASGGYTHLNLPMRSERRCVVRVAHPCSMHEDAQGRPTEPTPIGFKDPRPEGTLLWPERFPEELQPLRLKELGARGVAAQDQQRPVPAGGGIFKREHAKFWKVQPRGAEYIQSWDCTFKGLSSSDTVAGHVWARLGADYYLIDRVADQMGFAATLRAVLALSGKHRRAIRKLVEDKANGSAVIEMLQHKVPGLIAVNPQGGKLARANAVEPLWEAGNVYLPDPSIAPWVHDVLEQIVTFTGQEGRLDDDVDAMTQALIFLHSRTVTTYKQAMEKVR